MSTPVPRDRLFLCRHPVPVGPRAPFPYDFDSHSISGITRRCTRTCFLDFTVRSLRSRTPRQLFPEPPSNQLSFKSLTSPTERQRHIQYRWPLPETVLPLKEYRACQSSGARTGWSGEALRLPSRVTGADSNGGISYGPNNRKRCVYGLRETPR